MQLSIQRVAYWISRQSAGCVAQRKEQEAAREVDPEDLERIGVAIDEGSTEELDGTSSD